ncbi:MAG TPA: hypothetical protein VLS89_00555 [Candidatus Nanopelagicales bacterium]|nr:hypothetical protein [Candidatus Nanopelagicales bacterium]
MAGDAKNPEVGERIFDGSEFDYLKDAAPEEMVGLRTAQPGFPDVLKELSANEKDWGAKAGMTQEDNDNLVVLNQRIARLDVFIAPVRKFHEMLAETRALLEDKRQHIILNLGAGVERRGKETPELLARYQRTRAYRSAIAKKAAKTRKKNQQQAQRPPVT